VTATLGAIREDLLAPSQWHAARWLADREGAYLADPPGYGKTRALLAAATMKDPASVTVVCPAAIRDAGVWPAEAERIGYTGPLTVTSYHGAARPGGLPGAPGVLICDEAHWLKNRKVSWGEAIASAAKRADRTWLASGDPSPNGYAPELWAQLRVIRPMPAYWAWIREWFNVVPTRHSQFGVDGTLVACTPRCPPEDCEHWQAFYEATYAGLMLRRPESDIDLPPLVGADHPLETPMAKAQARAYRSLREDFLADLPHGITMEALNSSAQFQQLCMLSTGIGTADPAADPDNKHSGKMALLRETLPGRPAPSLVVVYYGSTARAVIRECDRAGLRYGEFGGNTSPAVRRQSVERFQAGELDVLVASVSVVSEGITLHTGKAVDMVERHWRPATNRQTVKRLHRRGQTGTVSVSQLVTPGTTDEAQWDELMGKRAGIARLMTRTEVASLV
jgi:SNF2 family DNA or RNA helicase